MPLTNIYSDDWMSSASSGLCIILLFRRSFNCILGCNKHSRHSVVVTLMMWCHIYLPIIIITPPLPSLPPSLPLSHPHSPLHRYTTQIPPRESCTDQTAITQKGKWVLPNSAHHCTVMCTVLWLIHCIVMVTMLTRVPVELIPCILAKAHCTAKDKVPLIPAYS